MTGVTTYDTGRSMKHDQELLEKLREMKKKMSYEAMGRLFGVSIQTLRRWLEGKSGISYTSEFLIRSKLRGEK